MKTIFSFSFNNQHRLFVDNSFWDRWKNPRRNEKRWEKTHAHGHRSVGWRCDRITCPRARALARYSSYVLTRSRSRSPPPPPSPELPHHTYTHARSKQRATVPEKGLSCSLKTQTACDSGLNAGVCKTRDWTPCFSDAQAPHKSTTTAHILLSSYCSRVLVVEQHQKIRRENTSTCNFK